MQFWAIFLIYSSFLRNITEYDSQGMNVWGYYNLIRKKIIVQKYDIYMQNITEIKWIWEWFLN